MILGLYACSDSNKTSDTPVTNNVKTEIRKQDMFSYEQYVKLVNFIKENLKFKSVTLKPSGSLPRNLTVSFDKEMSFGKKTVTTLNNEHNNKSTQYFLEYDDNENGYKIIIGLVYTDIYMGDNLLYFKPYTVGETNDMNVMWSFKNILIHLQTVSTSSDNSKEELGKENRLVALELVEFLEDVVSNDAEFKTDK